MINPVYGKGEDSLGHKYMTSFVRQAPPRQTPTKFLPLSIESILGRVEKDERDDDSGSEVENNKSEGKTEQTEDDVDVDIEGEEAGRLDGESSKQETQGEPSSDKQSPSYTAIIAQAILSSPDKKLPLGSIYEYIAEHFPEFLKKGQGWRNCVRHNLSLSECFVKAGRARNGRGNYWGIHPRYLKNFSKGDFRKRRASHRPRNRDLAIGLGADRLHYSHFLNPFIYPNTHRLPTDERSFSVESLLTPDRRGQYDRHSAFNTYKSRALKSEAHRLPGIYCPLGTSWLEHKPYSENTYHPYSVREAQQPVCSCHLYCCTRA